MFYARLLMVLALITSLVHGQEMVPQTGHQYTVLQLNYSPDQLNFASVAADSVIIWEIASGKAVRTFPRGASSYTCLTYNENGTLLAIGDMDGFITIRHTDSGEIKTRMKGYAFPVRELHFHGETLAGVASKWDDNNLIKLSELKLWNLETQEATLELPVSAGAVEPIAFSPDGKTIATGSIEHTLVIWNTETGERVRTFSQHNFLLRALAFHPDGTRIAAAVSGRDKDKLVAHGLLMWDALSGEELHQFQRYRVAIDALAFSPDGGILATAAIDKASRFNKQTAPSSTAPKKKKGWVNKMGNLKTKISAKVMGSDSDSENSPIGLTPLSLATMGPGDGPMAKFDPSLYATRRNESLTIFAGKWLSELQLWDTDSGTPLATLARASSPINALAFSGDGLYLVADSLGSSVKLWAVAEKRSIRDFDGPVRPIVDARYSPDGTHVAIISGDHYIRLWDLKNLGRVSILRGHHKRVTGIAFSPDGNLLASASEDTSLHLWDVSEARLLRTMKGHVKEPQSLCFSPDGSRIASAARPGLFGRADGLRFWRVEDGVEIVPEARKQRFKDNDYRSMAYSPDGAFLTFASSAGPVIAAADGTGSRTIKALSGAGSMTWTMAVSKDAETLVSGGGGLDWDTWKLMSDLRLWDLKTGLELREFKGHSSRVSSVALSPDGNFLASCADDNSLRLWDLASGEQVRSYTGRFSVVRFGPKGKTLLTGGSDGQIRIWSTEKDNYLVGLISIADGEEHIVYTPDMYYKSTHRGYDAMALVHQGKAYSFDQFDLALNRPDLVLSALPGHDPKLVAAYHHAYEKRLALMGGEARVSFDLPKVEIQERHLISLLTKQRSLELKLKISSDGSPLSRFQVRVNDVPIGSSAGFALKAETSLLQNITLELSTGENRIEIMAWNCADVRSYPESLIIVCEAESMPPNLYVLAVGVSDYSYKDSAYDLNFAAKDASDLGEMMTSWRDRFSSVEVKTLLDGEVTAENLRAARSFLEQAGTDDLVILFLSGHGLSGKGNEFYLATADMDFSEPEALGFAYGEIETLIDGLASRQKLVLIDACYSGESEVPVEQMMLPEGTRIRGFRPPGSSITAQERLDLGGSFELMKSLFVDLRRVSGAYVIASAAGNEFAFESERWSNGVFTFSLLEGLRPGEEGDALRADYNRDGKILVSELRDYTLDRVQTLTNGIQHPMVRRSNLAVDYSVLSLEKPQPPKQGMVAGLKEKASKLRKRFNGKAYKDEEKPNHSSDEFHKPKIIRLAENLGKSTEKNYVAEKGLYPAILDPDSKRMKKHFRPQPHPSGVFAFNGIYKGRKAKRPYKEIVDWVYHWPRAAGGSSKIFVSYSQDAKPIEVLLDETLKLPTNKITPVSVQALKLEEDVILNEEEIIIDGRKAYYVVTQTNFRSPFGISTRIFFHVLYTGEEGSFRLTITGGDLEESHDNVLSMSVAYSREYEQAIKPLFKRFEFLN